MGFSKLSRDKANSKLSLINAKGYKSRIKNRCIFTGKSRSILRKFGISQTSVRALARSGSIAGIKKASW
jgi:ribosomal protein S14